MVADRMIEYGFLWSLFWSPWGPVPRYFGWLVALIGFAIKIVRKEPIPPVFEKTVSYVCIGLLLWGGVGTWIAKHDLNAWGRGFSMLVEFLFACWLAAYVLKKEKNITRWVRIWYATIILTLAYSFYEILQSPLGEGLFSNINSLGIYICIIFPFALLYPGSNNFAKMMPIKRVGYVLVALLVFLSLVMSFTTAAWGSCSIALLLLLYFDRRVRKVTGLFFLMFILIASAGYISGNSTFHQVSNRFLREIKQITSFNDMSMLTTKRSDIWKVSYYMIKGKPLSGWGWGKFHEEFDAIRRKYVPQNRIKIADAHNMYFNLAIYGGIPTLLGVLFLFLTALKNMFYRFRQSGDKWRWLFLVCWVTIILILIYSIAGDVFSFRYKAAVLFWSVLGFGLQRRDRIFRA